VNVIDVHTHIFPREMATNRASLAERDGWFAALYGDPRAAMASAEDLLAEMDHSGVQVSAVCAFGWADQGLCVEHNAYLLEMGRRYPGRLLPFVAVQPRAGRGAVAEVERCAALGAAGIGELMPDGQGFSLDAEEAMAPVVEAALAHGLPIMSHASEPVGHMYPGKGTVCPDVLYRFAIRFPRSTLIAAHWGGGLPFYEHMPEVAHALANVYYDTAASPFLYRAGIFTSAVAAAGAKKILFGSDFALIGQRRFLDHVHKKGGLDAATLAQVLGGNAARLLHLKER